MGRPRSFDTEAVVHAAMLTFWQQGYEATSIRDLEAATGLAAPSLYGVFGNKEGIFTAALQHYLDEVIGAGVSATADHGLAGIRMMFASILAKDPDLPLGCLLAITSTEAGALGADPRGVLAGGLDQVRTVLRANLRQAIQSGSLDPDVDVPATADALLALYEGIQVLLRSSPDHVDVAAIAGPVLDRLLPAPPHHTTP